jgi:hypothetical protein
VVILKANDDPKLAVIISSAFILTMDYIYVSSSKETFEMIKKISVR